MKLKIYMKSGQVIPIACNEFEVKEDDCDKKTLKWKTTTKQRPMLLFIDTDQIEAVVRIK